MTDLAQPVSNAPSGGSRAQSTLQEHPVTPGNSRFPGDHRSPIVAPEVVVVSEAHARERCLQAIDPIAVQRQPYPQVVILTKTQGCIEAIQRPQHTRSHQQTLNADYVLMECVTERERRSRGVGYMLA